METTISAVEVVVDGSCGYAVIVVSDLGEHNIRISVTGIILTIIYLVFPLRICKPLSAEGTWERF